jgi:TonB family protein
MECVVKSSRWRKAGYSLFRVVTASLLLSSALNAASPPQERKILHRVEPVYPELARSNRIIGTVKLQLIIGRDGKVKSAEAMGGHPLLIEAALNAVEEWKYEPAAQETKAIVEFKFAPDKRKK